MSATIGFQIPAAAVPDLQSSAECSPTRRQDRSGRARQGAASASSQRLPDWICQFTASPWLNLPVHSVSLTESASSQSLPDCEQAVIAAATWPACVYIASPASAEKLGPENLIICTGRTLMCFHSNSATSKKRGFGRFCSSHIHASWGWCFMWLCFCQWNAVWSPCRPPPNPSSPHFFSFCPKQNWLFTSLWFHRLATLKTELLCYTTIWNLV